MHRITRIGVAVVAALALIVPIAFAQGQPIAFGKKASVELKRETRVGSAVLKPGHYQFQYQAADGQHFLVVRSQTTRRGATFGSHSGGKTVEEVARVPCRFVTSETKQRGTYLYLTENPDGTATVTRINIRDEAGGHIVVLEPQS